MIAPFGNFESLWTKTAVNSEIIQWIVLVVNYFEGPLKIFHLMGGYGGGGYDDRGGYSGGGGGGGGYDGRY